MKFSIFYEAYWQNPRSEEENCQLLKERKAMLLTSLGPRINGARVLDAGCGVGTFTSFFNELGFDVVGTDISSKALAHAKERCPGIQFAAASLEHKLPFRDEEFDFCWCTEVLEHLFDIQSALSEINRVLRPGGKLLLTTPYHGFLKNLAISLFFFDRHFDPNKPHIRFFTRRSLRRCLEQTGFVVEKSNALGRFWPLWMSHFVVARRIA